MMDILEIDLTDVTEEDFEKIEPILTEALSQLGKYSGVVLRVRDIDGDVEVRSRGTDE